jgi:hypothetical protein
VPWLGGWMQFGGFIMMALAFLGLWLVPGATTTAVPFLLLFGATYFFAEFGPNTTTFVYPAEIFPVRVRTSSHGIAAASVKIRAFVGTYALTAQLARIGLGSTSSLVGTVAAVGAVVTIILLPEPKSRSLEEISEEHAPLPTSVHVLALAHSRGVRPPSRIELRTSDIARATSPRRQGRRRGGDGRCFSLSTERDWLKSNAVHLLVFTRRVNLRGSLPSVGPVSETTLQQCDDGSLWIPVQLGLFAANDGIHGRTNFNLQFLEHLRQSRGRFYIGPPFV